MALVAFFFGLALGAGFCFWQQYQYRKHLRQILETLNTDASEVSLPLLARLRRGINLTNQEQKHLTERLQTWQYMLQVAPIGYLILDEENQLLWCNHRARQMLSIQRWEPGQIRLLLEVVRSYELDELIENTRQKQQLCEREWLFHPTSPVIDGRGSQQALTLRGYGWPLPQGQVGVFLENRQAMVELAQARDRWVSDLAHEFKTPLTSIRLMVEVLQTRLEPPWRHWADRLMQEVNRLINLVQDLLELRQMESTSVNSLNRQSLELRSLINTVWQTLEPLARQKELNLVYSGPDALWLEADESRLYRVFLNLLDNGIKYSPSQEIIKVEISFIPAQDSSSPGSLGGRKYVQIEVIDSGTGFPETELPLVFERFYRGDQARSRDISPTNSRPSLTTQTEENQHNFSSGSGLGLAIVQQIILAHGGSVKAKNHPETGGAWLQIKLPVS